MKECKVLEKVIHVIERCWTKNHWPESLLAWWGSYLYTQRTGKEIDIRKPQTFSQKIQWYKIFYKNPMYAKKLATPFPFVRVDFFDTTDKLYLAEMTFYPGGGFFKYNPEDYDEKLGKLFPIPKESN